MAWDFQDGKLFRRDQHFDAARQAGLAPDEARAFEGQHHLVDGRRGDAEVPLHLPFGRWPAMHTRVGVDEGQILRREQPSHRGSG